MDSTDGLFEKHKRVLLVGFPDNLYVPSLQSYLCDIHG